MGFLVKFKENVENLAKIKLKNGSTKYGLAFAETKLNGKEVILLLKGYSNDLSESDGEFIYVDEIKNIDILELEVTQDEQ